MSTLIDPQSTRVDVPVLPASTESHSTPASARASGSTKSKRAPGRRRNIAIVIVLGVFASAFAAPRIFDRFRDHGKDFIFHTVERGTLPISVVERGNLESQNDVKVFCEVDDIHGDGIEGTAIIWIIPNGEHVKAGDLLVEIDSAGHLEQLDLQILDTDRVRAEQIQSDVIHKNQISMNETAKAEAALAVELAKLQLKMFKDVEKGTHKLEVDAIQREIDDTENEILAAKASLQLARNEKDGIEALFKLGYQSKSEVDRTRLDYLQAQSTLAASINRLKTKMATLKKKTDYEWEMSLLQFDGDVETTKRNLEQVQLNNEADLAQAVGALNAANRALTKEQERLARYEQQLKNCKIYAEQEGMVAYAASSRYSRSSTIGEGALVRKRQQILSLPNLTRMQVKTAVHESVQNQIKEGLPVTIRLNAFPDRAYTGSVKSVDVLPDQGNWSNSDTKMYKTFVTIDEEVQDLKPGMTAVVEIHVAEVHDALTVPVQAIIQSQQSTYCYVERQGRVERQEIEVGRSNEKFVEIKSGLVENDRVVLNTNAVVDE